MFHPDDADDEELAAQRQELLNRAGDALDEGMNALGVYAAGKTIWLRPDVDGARSVLLWTGTLGRVALGPRIQDPDRAAVDEAFDDMTEHLINDEYEQKRRELLDDDEIEDED